MKITVTCAALALVILTSAQRSDACGPFFETEYLADRPGTMSELPEGVFYDEVLRVIAPEVRAFPRSEKVTVDDGYARAAALFHKGDPGARAAFEAHLARPVVARKDTTLMAHYSLGRLCMLVDAECAINAFEAVRAADERYKDPDGLRAASYGEQAYVLWRGGDVEGALALYAQQAHHDENGLTSLLFVIRHELKDDQGAELLSSPLGHRLLAIYLATRGHEVDEKLRAKLLTRYEGGAPGAEYLAPIAWRAGDFDRAARLAAATSEHPRSRWILAKHAALQGDDAAAKEHYGALFVTMKCNEAEPSHECVHVAAERAIVALSKGEYQTAAARAYEGGEIGWTYLVERVLTVEELVRFTDLQAAGRDSRAASPQELELRYITAKRLMREGRHEDAARYFDDEALRAASRELAAAHRAAKNAPDDLARAVALYAASKITRQLGLELLGTHHAPDWGSHGGSFDLGASEVLPARWSTREEVERAKRSAPIHDARFHYRHLAADLAEEAAELVPKRSHAYAALLCHAARYVRADDQARLQNFYARWAANGAQVPFSNTFGQTCPEPDFAKIARQRREVSQKKWILWGGIATGCYVALLAGVVAYRRRRRAKI